MLREDERRCAEECVAGDYRYADHCRGDLEIDVQEELVRFGRAEYRDHPTDASRLRLYLTEAGERALRIDALIRQWGWK